MAAITKSAKPQAWSGLILALALCLAVWTPRPAAGYSLGSGNLEAEGAGPDLYAWVAGAAAPGRALARHEILKHFEWGFRTEYVFSEIGNYNHLYAGNLVLFSAERKMKSLRSPFFAGGRFGGGYFTNGGSEITGGLGCFGGVLGLEAGARPSRLDLSLFFGFGGANLAARTEADGIEAIVYRARGFFLLQPSLQWVVSTSPFSSLAFSAGYAWMPFGEGWNLGGPTAALTLYFNR